MKEWDNITESQILLTCILYIIIKYVGNLDPDWYVLLKQFYAKFDWDNQFCLIARWVHG